MKALVTGGTGFVGSHLLAALVAQGIVPRALVRSPRKAEVLGLSGVEWVPGDLNDVEALRRAARGVELVFHLAGLVAARDEAEFHAVNVEGTRRLVAAASDTGARFVLVSSLAAAGPAEPGRPHRGGEPARPISAYGRSKLTAEAVVREGPLPWTILRPPTVYGPRDTELLRLFRAAARGLAPVFGAGHQELSVVYGPDLALALVDAALAGAAEGGIFYPAHPERLTQRDLARKVGAALGRRVTIIPIPIPLARGLLVMTGAAARLANRPSLLTPDKGVEFFQPAWTCDPSSLEAATGWLAAHDLAQGAAKTAAWYRDQGWV